MRCVQADMNTADIQLEHPRHIAKIIDYKLKCVILDENVLAMLSGRSVGKAVYKIRD